jgi:hypothetical protein
LCLGIALASGAPLFSGIVAGIAGGLVTGFLSGSQISVSGPAAGLTVIVAGSITSLANFQFFLVAVVLAGVFQLLFGVLKGGVVGNFCSAPTFSYPTNSGGTFIIKYSTNNNAQTASMLSQDNSLSNRNWIVQLQINRTIIFLYKLGLAASAQSTASIPSNFDGYLKVEAITVGSDMVIKFYTSTDGITYNQLGSTITKVGDGNTFSTSSSPLQVGANSTDGGNPFNGKIYLAEVYDGNGNLIKKFNPNSYNAATSQTAWTSSTGEVWTINTGTATVGYKGVLVDRTIVQGDGVDDKLVSGTLTSRQYFTGYSAAKIFVYNATEKTIYSGLNTSHLLYATTALFAYNGVDLSSTSTSVALNSQTVDFNSASSKIRINAGSDITGNTGTQSSTVVVLFNYNTTIYGQTSINTVIQSLSIDSVTIKTSVYNFLRTLSNNAF